MTLVKHLKVPKEWADELDLIAKKEDPLKSWADKARQILRLYLDTRKGKTEEETSSEGGSD